MNYYATEREEASPAREPDTFRRLVENEITPDEYVETLERRVTEQRENGGGTSEGPDTAD